MRLKINDQVAKDTKNKIKDLFSEGTISDSTKLVICNAIHFKADWGQAFSKQGTHKSRFFGFDSDFDIDLMYRKFEKGVKYAGFNEKGERLLWRGKEDEIHFKILELPYKGDDLSMLIILPSNKESFVNFEKSFKASELNAWMNNLRETKVKVWIPKFKQENNIEGFKEILQSFGMKAAFNSEADFSGISTSKRLFISSVVHKAYIDVNEKGTEAAAATGLGMKAVSGRLGEIPLPSFRADKPFIYLIKDNCTDTILFMGRFTKPSKNNTKQK